MDETATLVDREGARGLMAPYWYANGAFGSGTGAVTAVPPTGHQAGDLMILFVESANQTANQPANWTNAPVTFQGAGTAGAANSTRLTAFYRIANSSSEANVAVNDTGDHTCAFIHGFRNVDNNSPFNASIGQMLTTPGTAWNFPAVTTTIDKALIVNAVALDADANNTSQLTALTNAGLANLTLQAQRNVNSGNGGGLGVATGVLLSAGNCGNTTVTSANSTIAGFMTFALTPAPNTVSANWDERGLLADVEGFALGSIYSGSANESGTSTDTAAANNGLVAARAESGVLVDSGSAVAAQLAAAAESGALSDPVSAIISQLAARVEALTATDSASSGASGGGTVTFQAAANVTGADVTSANIIGFNSGAGANVGLYVAVSMDSVSAGNLLVDSLAVTANGTALLPVANGIKQVTGNWNGLQWFYFNGTPPSVAYNISATWNPAAARNVVVGAIALNNVDTTKFYQNVASNETSSANVSVPISSASGDYTLAAASYGSGLSLGSSLQTQQWSQVANAAVAGAGSSAAGNTTVTHGWTANGTDIGAIVGFDVPAAPGGGGGTTYTGSENETGAAVDTSNAVNGLPGSRTDAVVATDSAASGNQLASALNESGVLTAAQSAALLQLAAALEALAATDTEGGVITQAADMAISWAQFDPLSGSVPGDVTETAPATDAVAAAMAAIANATEALVGTAAQSSLGSILAALAEALTSADAPAASTGLPASLAEVGALTDQVSGIGGFLRAVVEALTATDAAGGTITPVGQAFIDEVTALVDGVGGAGAFGISVLESAVLNDAALAVAVELSALLESLAATDGVSTGQALAAFEAETAVLADQAAGTTLQGGATVESGTLVDGLGATAVQPGLTSESAALTDTAGAGQGSSYAATSNEAGAVTDGVAGQAGQAGVTTDAGTLTDVPGAALSGLTVLETLTVVDGHLATLTLTGSADQVAALQDLANALGTFGLTISEIGLVSDAYSGIHYGAIRLIKLYISDRKKHTLTVSTK